MGAVFGLPWAQSGLQSLIWPVPVPKALFRVHFDQVIPVAPKLASPQARITFAGLNFGFAQLLISSGSLPPAVAAGAAMLAVAIAAIATKRRAARRIAPEPYPSKARPKRG